MFIDTSDEEPIYECADCGKEMTAQEVYYYGYRCEACVDYVGWVDDERQECLRCGGTGIAEFPNECPVCGGTGSVAS